MNWERVFKYNLFCPYNVSLGYLSLIMMNTVELSDQRKSGAYIIMNIYYNIMHEYIIMNYNSMAVSMMMSYNSIATQVCISHRTIKVYHQIWRIKALECKTPSICHFSKMKPSFMIRCTNDIRTREYYEFERYEFLY